MEDSEKAGGELRKVSEAFVLGLLKAALTPYGIDVGKVRMVLRLAVAQGYDPVLLYRKALEGRPERWEKPPLADLVVSREVEEAPPSKSLKEVQEVSDKAQSASAE